MYSYMSAIGAIIITRKSRVMGHKGHGSVHWWVRWVMGHKEWPTCQLCLWRADSGPEHIPRISSRR